MTLNAWLINTQYSYFIAKEKTDFLSGRSDICSITLSVRFGGIVDFQF